LGIPSLVFDLGAQADRVKQAGFGVVLPRSMARTPGELNDALLKLSAPAEWDKRRAVRFPGYADISAYYKTEAASVLEESSTR